LYFLFPNFLNFEVLYRKVGLGRDHHRAVRRTPTRTVRLLGRGGFQQGNVGGPENVVGGVEGDNGEYVYSEKY
jgi:hypothetical protein